MQHEKMILFVTILTLFVATAYASDISTDTTTDDITDNMDTTNTYVTIETKEIENEEKIITETKINKEEKNTKTESIINVNEYSSLNNTLCEGFDDVSINITQDITLDDNLSVGTSINTLTINGNNKTINGNQHRFLYIPSGINVIINNLNIINCHADKGGAIYNEGTLSITESTLNNNNANYDGGVIYNNGILTITNITLNNNNATYGGTIFNNGTLLLTDSILTNNKADWGGAIYNSGTLNITGSQLNYNNGTLNTTGFLSDNKNLTFGGAIFNGGLLTITNSTLNNNGAIYGGAIFNGGLLSITDSILNNNIATYWGGAIRHNTLKYANITNSNFTANYAINGSAIYASGYMNLTGNLFVENNAFTETIDLMGWWNGQFKDNVYESTVILINTVNLSVKDNQEDFKDDDNITLTFNINLANPNYYGSDLLKILYVNGEKYLTRENNYTLTNLKADNYSVYYTFNNNKSNTVTFKVTGESNITTPSDSYDYYEGIKNNITVNIKDSSEEGGTIDIFVKEEEKYIKLISLYNIKNGPNIPIESIANALKSIYNTLEESYTITMNYTSNNEYVIPSSTEFTLNIIKQRNTTIAYNILNQTEKNVQINITVLDTVDNIPVDDAQIKITGDINQNTTSGIITDTTLTQGEYTINITYEETEEYNPSNTTITFTVEIDKIAKLEETITNLTQQLNESNNTINTLNESVKNLTNQITELSEENTNLSNQVVQFETLNKQLNETITNLTNTNEALNTTLTNLTAQNNQLQNQNNNLNQTIQQQNTTITDLNNTVNSQNVIINDLNGTVNSQNVIINDLNATIENQNVTINDLNATVKSQNFTINNLNTNVKDLNSTVKSQNSTIKTMNTTINDLNSTVNSQNTTIKTMNTIIKDLNNTIKSQNKTISNLNTKIDNLSSQIEYLNEVIENLTKPKEKLSTKITINPITGSVGNTTTITAQVLDQKSNKVNEGKVVFKVNGITLKDEAGNVIYSMVEGGKATLNYIVPKGWTKNVTVSAVFSSTENYMESRTNTTNVKIQNGTVTLAVDNIATLENGNKAQFVVKVSDANNNPVDGGVVIIKANGVTLKDASGKALQSKVQNGVAVITYDVKLSARTYDITAVYSNSGYNRAEGKSTLTVTKGEIFIKYDPITTKTNTTTINAQILDKDKKLITSNVKVAIKINGKTVATTTAVKGIINATIPTAYKEGTYTLVLTAGETGAYKSDKLTSVIIKE